MLSTLLLFVTVAAVAAWWLGRNRALYLAGDDIGSLHSRPNYHGAAVAIATALPALLLIPVWNWLSGVVAERRLLSGFAPELEGLSPAQLERFLSDARNAAAGDATSAGTGDLNERAVAVLRTFDAWSDRLLVAVVVLLVIGGFLLAYRSLTREKRTRHAVERTIRTLLIFASAVAIFTTVGIVLSLIFESIRFFGMVPFFDFLFGTNWSPQSAFEGAGREAAAQDFSAIFGAVPLFAGTLLITLIAMCVAAPIGLMSAVYLADYASPKFRAVAKPVLEILAGVPTVVYGFFAALTVAPAIRGWGESLGLDVSSESALAAGLVMGIMIIPFVSSLSDDVINAVPQSLRDGSAGLGATKSETIRKVVLPAALPGIVSALMLAVSRAIGETMIVVMAAGLAANLTANPLEAVTTVTVQIVTLLVGDQEFDSAKTLAAFALGLTLFVVTLTLNVIALRVVQRYREQYD